MKYLTEFWYFVQCSIFPSKQHLSKSQKQPPRGVPRKRCSGNTLQIYRRTPMPKCDFNKVTLQPRHGCSPVNLLPIFRTHFPRNTSGWLPLKSWCWFIKRIEIRASQFPSNLPSMKYWPNSWKTKVHDKVFLSGPKIFKTVWVLQTIPELIIMSSYYS